MQLGKPFREFFDASDIAMIVVIVRYQRKMHLKYL